ncbi:glycosyltransferase [Aquitalea sp. LB_tupeE]|nr:glycosyltransferase [Aquitalea sp. LB_tupeE]
MVHHPYYIVSPPYRETSSGVRVLHLLCHYLRQRGMNAYVTTSDGDAALDTPQLTDKLRKSHHEAGLEPIVIYPEIIPGNPYGARTVVRYILNKPGFLGGESKYHNAELLFTYNQADFVPAGMQADVLRVPVFNTELFNNNNNPHDGQRKGRYYYANRYCTLGGVVDPEIVQNATELSMANPRSLSELAALFREAECLYSYEMSAMCTEAMLCGCPVIYIPNPWMQSIPALQFFHGDGVAWGNTPEQVSHAKATVHKILGHYQEHIRQFDEQLSRFIEVTQKAASDAHQRLMSRVSLTGGASDLRTRRSLPPVFESGNQLPSPEERIRVGVLSGDVVDGACMRLRLHDGFSLLSPWLDTVYFPGNGVYGCRPEAVDIERLVAWSDVFVLQRGAFSDRNDKFIKALFASGKPIVFELDDWLPAMPSSHRQYLEFDPNGLWRTWKQHLHQISAVTVSTEAIAAHLRPLHDNVQVLPNALLASRYDKLSLNENDSSKPLTIGFAGTSTHVGDIKVINQALLNIQQKYGPHMVRFVFWGCVPLGFEGAQNVRVVSQGVTYPHYLEQLNKLGLDIAIAPLEDNLFNQGKSDLKWLEYSAAGAAAVLSDVVAYEEAKQLQLALVVSNDTKSWESALIQLIEDASLRTSLVARSREYLQQFATLETQCYRWIELLKPLLPTSRAKILDGYHPALQSNAQQGDIMLMGPDPYRAWQNWKNKHELREIDAEMMAERMLMQWQQRPQFLMLMTIRASEAQLLANTIDALQQQLYKNWKLIVIADWDMPDPIFSQNDTLGWLQLDTLDDPQLFTMALNGLLGEVPADWVMLLPAGAMPAPQLFLRMGDTIHAQPQALAIYTDHDSYTQPECRVLPQLKPDFSLDYLRAQDYVGAAVALSYQGLASLGGFEPYPACECWNHLLRLAENFGLNVVQHIDEVLMHLPAEPLGVQHQREAARQVALENHLQRLGIAASVVNGYAENTLHVEYQVSGTPLVSVIIPTRDKMEYLQPCVESLFARTTYHHFELLIIDNGSQDPDTFRFYQDLQQDYPDRVRIIDYPQPFNFSAQCNLGVEQARGEYIVLLNNDTEIIQPEWLERMIGIAQRPEVGAVGIRLVYPESGSIQHAGIVLGLPGGVLSVADHVFEKSELDAPGYMNRLLTEQNYSAVTAACLMVSREKYQAVGGFDAEQLTVLFNDVDFCLKLQQQGLLNVFTPYITMVHHHAKSIGKLTYEPAVALAAAVREQQELAVVLKRWLPQLARDPAYNRHLTFRTKDMAFEPTRDVNWLPHLAGRYKVLGLPIPGGSGEYRVSLPFHALQEGGRLDVAMISPENGAAPLLSVVEMARFNPDALLIHTMLTDGVLHAVKQYREFMPNLRLVFGLDDLVGALPEKSILNRVWRKTMPDARPRLRAMLKHFDTLVVSTEPLAEACRDMIDDIRVVPNRLARHMWGKVSSLRGQGKKPRVGWVGAQQHQGDLSLIIDVVKQTADEVEWVFMGMCLPEMRPYIAEEHPCVSFQEYPEKMASLNLDLAIAPLEINPFNESKSNLRLLEYGVMRWPVICTDIYPYRTNDAPVCRVPNTTEAWVEAIRSRIHDLESTYREGDALRAWVDRHYWIEDHLEDWQQALTGQAVKK